MNLTPPLQYLASDTIASTAGDAARCEAANFRWESAVSAKRADEYGADVGPVATHAEWKAEHQGYVTSRIYVAKDHPSGAECFRGINDAAHLNESMDNAHLLRLESLGYLFDNPLLSDTVQNFWQRFYNSQKDLFKTKFSDSDEALRAAFMAQWKEHRTQARPMFATFLNDFGGNLMELAKQDWPHMLRDRLGLLHWPSMPGKALPVALMCYTVDEVRAVRMRSLKKGAVASFTRPTVLDMEMSTAFIPAPLLAGGASYGYTLDLANPGIPDSFAPELLTFPIDYEPRHLKALGFITKPHTLQDDQAKRAARNRHVQGLQALPGCAGFGEVLP